MKKRIIKSRGFSLLEIIFVLAFMGILLLAVGNYARKLIDERNRQATADAVVQEVYGALQFINAGSITATVNNVTKKIINPLYQQPADPISEDLADINTLGIQNNPLWLAHPGSSAEALSQNVSPYIARSWSKSVITPVSNGLQVTDPGTGTTYYSHSLKWSRAVWGPDSVRRYFTDSACAGASGHVYFNQQFLSCDENPVLRGSEIAISRIDLVSDKGTVSRPAGATTAVPVGIDRVDVYISFSPVDNNPARIDQFITPLMTAFRLKKITPNTNAIYLVRQQTPVASNAWTLLDKTTGQPAPPTTPDANLAHFSDLPDMIDKLQRGQTYAIRFSFDGRGDYLRTDGLNSADKVCWNTTTGAAGPCLTSPAQDALVLKQRQNIQEFANLQVGNVISKGHHIGTNGTIEDEYYTSPQTLYAAFTNKGLKPEPLYRKRNSDGSETLCDSRDRCGQAGYTPSSLAKEENGAISVPVQQCPSNVLNGNLTPDVIKMYPRLSVTVSSLVSGIPVMGSGDSYGIDQSDLSGVFNNSGLNLNPSGTVSPLGNLTINRLGGVILQISKDNDTINNQKWHISSLVATEGIDSGQGGNIAHSWQYFNPSWLSVVITSWCSSVPQN
ncbi:type II secretion system protein [Salmonella enterica]|nr:type II secretion system protein [Salmonella enterica subsp. enterica serovar Infantis]EDW6859423.1 type II secretion system protein [Salmonella enterica]EEJ5736462.1 type II secretion system protein [Salmonella enterica]